MNLLLHFKLYGDIDIQEYKLYGDVDKKFNKCLMQEGEYAFAHFSSFF